jgi:HNH endonuclease
VTSVMPAREEVVTRCCCVAGCEEPARTRGFCNMHYLRYYRRGDPHAVLRGGRPPIIQTGDIYGRLVVVGEAPREKWSSNGKRHYNVICTCGAVTVVCGGDWSCGDTRSCGCLRLETVAANCIHAAVPPAVPEDRGYETPCLIWQGFINAGGYGQKGRNTLAHRESFIAAHGPIPDDHHVHHKCRQRDCVNPDHLEALSPQDHVALHSSERRPTCAAMLAATPALGEVAVILDSLHWFTRNLRRPRPYGRLVLARGYHAPMAPGRVCCASPADGLL